MPEKSPNFIRNIIITRDVLWGESLTSVSKKYGISGGRVRQIVMRCIRTAFGKRRWGLFEKKSISVFRSHADFLVPTLEKMSTFEDTKPVYYNKNLKMMPDLYFDKNGNRVASYNLIYANNNLYDLSGTVKYCIKGKLMDREAVEELLFLYDNEIVNPGYNLLMSLKQKNSLQRGACGSQSM